ncbi:hypothetical protein ACOSP7_031941 [Xanthoceras sorbifolium]
MLKCLPKLKLRQIHAYNCTSVEVLSCVSFKSCFQPRDNYDIFANFGNSRSVVCYPGHEIPKWFNFRSMRSLINVELPQNCLSHNFIGFVMCVVLAAPCVDHQVKFYRRRLHWKCNLKSKDGHPCIVGVSLENGFKLIGSHHVFMALVCKIAPHELLCYENEISFFRNGEGYTVEKCGVHLMFAQPLEEPNVSFRVGEVEDFLSLASVHDNCEEVDEPHPNRLKFN